MLGPAILYDAICYLKRAAPHRRQAIILISDNCHLYGLGVDKARGELLESYAALYNIVTLSNDTNKEYCLKTNPWIRYLAEETGGEVFEVQGAASLKGALETVISRLRTQYTLGFNPSDPGDKGSFHKLTIRFANKKRCPNCRIIGRRGYYVGIPAPLILPEKEITTPIAIS